MAILTNETLTTYVELGLSYDLPASANFTVTGEGVTVLKTCSPNFGPVGTTTTYTVLITNGSTETITNLNFIDVFPARLDYVDGSLTINGVPSMGDIFTGLSLNNMIAGAVTTITYQATVLPA